MGRFLLGAEKVPVLRRNTRILARQMLTGSGMKGKVLGEGGGGETPQEKDRDCRRLAFMGVKNCRSRPHLGCARLKARSTPAESQDF